MKARTTTKYARRKAQAAIVSAQARRRVGEEAAMPVHLQ
jgi:hypothetical protein